MGMRERERKCSYFASLVLSLSSLPHSQSLPGSTAKCRASSLCSESVSGITARNEGQKEDVFRDKTDVLFISYCSILYRLSHLFSLLVRVHYVSNYINK